MITKNSLPARYGIDTNKLPDIRSIESGDLVLANQSLAVGMRKLCKMVLVAPLDPSVV